MIRAAMLAIVAVLAASITGCGGHVPSAPQPRPTAATAATAANHTCRDPDSPRAQPNSTKTPTASVEARAPKPKTGPSTGNAAGGGPRLDATKGSTTVVAQSGDDTIYGDPEAATRYWVKQNENDCGLMSTRMVIGELTGDPPTESEIVSVANATPSQCLPGQPIYDTSFDEATGNPGHGTCTQDLPLLLAHYHLGGAFVDDDHPDDTNSGFTTGMQALKDDLLEGFQALVSVNSSMVWNGHAKGDGSDHMVMVAAIDPKANRVYLGDTGGEDTRGEIVSLDTFETAWQMGGHELVVAGLG